MYHQKLTYLVYIYFIFGKMFLHSSCEKKNKNQTVEITVTLAPRAGKSLLPLHSLNIISIVPPNYCPSSLRCLLKEDH